jgi:hypothetical protein
LRCACSAISPGYDEAVLLNDSSDLAREDFGGQSMSWALDLAMAVLYTMLPFAAQSSSII